MRHVTAHPPKVWLSNVIRIGVDVVADMASAVAAEGRLRKANIQLELKLNAPLCAATILI